MTAAVRTGLRQRTPEWLEARRDSIGSSDAPVVAGERGSLIDLWAIKSGRLDPAPPDTDTARLFEWGHRLEPVVADWYSDHTGRPLRRVSGMLQHPTIPYLTASLDRVSATKGERRIVEIKTDRWGWRGDERLPGSVKAQVQH
ncbi:MAG: YqaJ viral recombinase family protein, partial [Candidatus Limnocylindrales bacterium]